MRPAYLIWEVISISTILVLIGIAAFEMIILEFYPEIIVSETNPLIRRAELILILNAFAYFLRFSYYHLGKVLE